MATEPTPADERQADMDAPSLRDCLARRGVYGEQTLRARRALLDWLGSWRGCTPARASGDEVLAYLDRMAGLGR